MIRDEHGYTLVEMLVVMLILGVVVTGLTTIFVSGTHAEIDLNRRFQAQQQARAALDRIRTDVHCAVAAQAQQIATYNGVGIQGVAISAPNCTTGKIDYCLFPVATNRYALYRTISNANTCLPTDTQRVLIADYLTRGDATVFQTPGVQGTMLEVVLVDFPVSVNPDTTKDVYELKDSLVARNSSRCTSGPCSTTISPYAVSP